MGILLVALEKQQVARETRPVLDPSLGVSKSSPGR